MNAKYLMCALVITLQAGWTQCQVGSNEPPPLMVDPFGQGAFPNAWPRGATVPYVMFNGQFCNSDFSSCYWTIWPTNLSGDFVTAMHNYEVFGISFSFYGTSQTPPDHPSLKAILVNPSDIRDGAVASTTSGYWRYGTTWALGTVTIYLRNTITSDHFLQFAASHELGHTFALADCYSCAVNTTVMVSGLNSPQFNSATDGLTAPSDCDAAQVFATAYP